jgi:uncharacterized protein
MHLLDVNVWLALSFSSHIHHLAAKSWFDSLPPGSVCNFCRLTQMGFLRLATNAKVFGPDTLTLTQAWASYDAMIGDPRIAFRDEPIQIETHWRSFTQGQTFSTKVWNDAYLAAFALAAGLELVTFDQGFAAFGNVSCRILT